MMKLAMMIMPGGGGAGHYKSTVLETLGEAADDHHITLCNPKEDKGPRKEVQRNFNLREAQGSSILNSAFLFFMWLFLTFVLIITMTLSYCFLKNLSIDGGEESREQCCHQHGCASSTLFLQKLGYLGVGGKDIETIMVRGFTAIRYSFVN